MPTKTQPETLEHKHRRENMEPQLMYPDRRANIGATEGCPFGCIYCETSFQAVLKKFAKHDKDKTFEPHLHLNRLDKKPPRTIGTQYVTIGLTGDISAAPESAIRQIIEYCKKWKGRTTFMLQSKNPAFFLKYSFPPNVILATTIETNYTVIPGHAYNSGTDYPYSAISKAPPPEERLMAMLGLMVKDTNPLMVTIEPILGFRAGALETWMMGINERHKLIAINIGYDSSPETNKLPEPALAETEKLIENLKAITEVRVKQIRKAWWE